jgi:membrane protein required for colicin V production
VNWTDYIIIGVLALSVLVGLWRGLIAELLSLVIWIAAFWVAAVFGATVAAQFEHAISLPMARISLGYAICFFGVLLLGALLRFATRRLIQSTGLGGVDRLFGLAFGFIRGALLVAVLVFLVGLTAVTRESWWQQSVLLPQFQGLAAWLGQNVPAGVRDHLQPEAVLGKVDPAAMLDRINHAAVIDSLPGALSGQLHAPTSGAAQAPATSRTAAAPATATSIAGYPRNP